MGEAVRQQLQSLLFTSIANEVNEQDWTKEEMVHFVHDNVFGSIPQLEVENYLQRMYKGHDKDGRAKLTHNFVSSVMYRYLASVESLVLTTTRRWRWPRRRVSRTCCSPFRDPWA